MREKLSKLIEQYIMDAMHYGEEEHSQASLILHELKEQLNSLQEDTKDSCFQTIKEFQKTRPEHQELFQDFLTYIKHCK